MAAVDVVAARSGPQPTGRPAVAIGARYALLGLVAVALAAVHMRRPATVCLLRATTGVPCPLCGGTTAMVRLGHGDAAGALAASPLAVVLAAALPLVGHVHPPRWWRSARLRRSCIVAILVASEVWQLLRLGVIHL